MGTVLPDVNLLNKMISQLHQLTMFGDVTEHIYTGSSFYITYLSKICYFTHYNKNMDTVASNDNGYLY